jgi:hypothetical protein
MIRKREQRITQHQKRSLKLLLLKKMKGQRALIDRLRIRNLWTKFRRRKRRNQFLPRRLVKLRSQSPRQHLLLKERIL